MPARVYTAPARRKEANKMTLDTARRITQGILDGERGEVFDPDNAADLEAIEALSLLLNATSAKSKIDTVAPPPARPPRRHK
jgi:hypothetical protein